MNGEKPTPGSKPIDWTFLIATWSWIVGIVSVVALLVLFR